MCTPCRKRCPRTARLSGPDRPGRKRGGPCGRPFLPRADKGATFGQKGEKAKKARSIFNKPYCGKCGKPGDRAPAPRRRTAVFPGFPHSQQPGVWKTRFFCFRAPCTSGRAPMPSPAGEGIENAVSLPGPVRAKKSPSGGRGTGIKQLGGMPPRREGGQASFSSSFSVSTVKRKSNFLW